MSLRVEVSGAIPPPIRSSVPRLTARAEPDQRIMKVALSVFAIIACFALTPPPLAIILSVAVIASIFLINWNEGTPQVHSDFPRHSGQDSSGYRTQGYVPQGTTWNSNPTHGRNFGASSAFHGRGRVPVGGEIEGRFELGAPEPSGSARISTAGYYGRSTTPPPSGSSLLLYSLPVSSVRGQDDLPSAPPLSSGRRSDLPLGAPEPRGRLPIARENDSASRGSSSSGQRRTSSTSGRTHAPAGGDASSGLRLGAPGEAVREAPPRAGFGARRERVKVGSGNGFVGNPDE